MFILFFLYPLHFSGEYAIINIAADPLRLNLSGYENQEDVYEFQCQTRNHDPHHQ